METYCPHSLYRIKKRKQRDELPVWYGIHLKRHRACGMDPPWLSGSQILFRPRLQLKNIKDIKVEEIKKRKREENL